MSIFGIIGGLGQAYQGLQRGIDEAQKREDLDNERTHLKEERAFQRDQRIRDQAWQDKSRTRQEADWANADKDRAVSDKFNTFKLDQLDRETNLNRDLANIQDTQDFRNPEVMKITVDDDGNPSATQLPAPGKPRLLDDILRDTAKAYAKAGNRDKFLEYNAKAMSVGMARSADKFAALRASSASMSVLDLAKAAKSIYDKDPLPSEISDVIDDGEDGVTITVTNRDTGAITTKQYQKREQLLADLEGHYSPETYRQSIAAQQKFALEKQLRDEEYASKERIAAIRAGNGRPIIGKPGDIAYNPDGTQTQLGTPDPIKNYLQAWDGVKAPAGQELSPRQQAMGRLIVSELAVNGNDKGQKIPEALAVVIAQDIAADPSKAVLELNPETGSFQRRYRIPEKPEYGSFLISADPNQVVDPKAAKQATNDMLSRLGDASTQALYLRAAFDPKAREQLLAPVAAPHLATLKSAETEILAMPAGPQRDTALAQARAAAQARIDTASTVINNRLGVIAKYGDRPPASAPAPAARQPVAKKQTVDDILVSQAGSSEALKSMATKQAAEIGALHQELSRRQDELRAAAASGDQVGQIDGARKTQEARNALNSAISKLPEGARERVLQSLGLS